MVFAPFGDRPVSTFDGSIIPSQEALKRFVDDSHAAYGMVGLTVGEARSLGLEIIEDRMPDPEHISLNYLECSRNEVKRIFRAIMQQSDCLDVIIVCVFFYRIHITLFHRSSILR